MTIKIDCSALSPVLLFNSWGIVLLVALIAGVAIYSIRRKMIF